MCSKNINDTSVTACYRTQLKTDTYNYTWIITDFWTIYHLLKKNEIKLETFTDTPFILRMTVESDKLDFSVCCTENTKFHYRMFLKTTKKEKRYLCKSKYASTTDEIHPISLTTINVATFNENYISNNTLTVYFEFRVYQILPDKLMFLDMLEPYRILNQNNLILGDNMDSLISIKTEEKCLYVSKFLLCSKSTVFNAMFNTDSSKNLKKSATNEVKITDISYNVIKMLLSCLYFLQMGILPGLNTDIETIGELLRAADKYDIKDVKSLCEHRLIMELTSENIIKLLDIACRHNSEILKEYGSKIMKLNITDIVNTPEFVTLIGKYPELLNQIDEKEHQN